MWCVGSGCGKNPSCSALQRPPCIEFRSREYRGYGDDHPTGHCHIMVPPGVAWPNGTTTTGTIHVQGTGVATVTVSSVTKVWHVLCVCERGFTRGGGGGGVCVQVWKNPMLLYRCAVLKGLEAVEGVHQVCAATTGRVSGPAVRCARMRVRGVRAGVRARVRRVCVYVARNKSVRCNQQCVCVCARGVGWGRGGGHNVQLHVRPRAGPMFQ